MLGTRNMSSLISVNLNIIKQFELNPTFLDREENQNRIKDYFFPSFAGDVIEKIAGIAEEGKSDSFFLSGRPGSGKSNLLLFLMNYLRSAGESEEMKNFAKLAKDFPLAEMKEKTGSFLVVNPLPLSDTNKTQFENAVISAITGALNREELNFIPRVADSAAEVIEETLDFLVESGKYKGIFIAIDDFEAVIRDFDEGGKSPLGKEVRGFLKFLKKEHKLPVIFAATASLIPEDYLADVLEDSTRASIGKFFGHVVRLSYNNLEWLDFVTENILQHDSMEALDVLTMNQEFQDMADFIFETGVFREKGIDYVQNHLLPGCFPLHPFTLIFLPELSEKVCNQEKNLLSFFRSTAPGSFRYFLETFGIFQASGKLSVYTPDYLFSYYEQVIKTSPRLRNIYTAVERAYMLSGNMPLARRVIRLIALMQIIDDPNIRPTKKNILEALHVTPRDKKRFEPMLIEMVQKQGLNFDRKTQEISLPVEKTSINLKDFTTDRIEKILKSRSHKDILNESYLKKEMTAADYNHRYKTDRKVMFRYIDVKDLRDKDFYSRIISSLADDEGRYLGHAAILYFVTDDDEELMEARQILAQPEWEEASRMIIAVSVRPCGFFNILVEKEALIELREKQPPFTDPDSNERELLENHLKEVSEQLEEKLEIFLRPTRLYWYFRSNAIPQMQEKTIEELVNALMDENYHAAPVVDNPAVSSFHDKRKFRKVRQRAVEKIVISRDRIKIKKDSKDPADKLIRDVLIKNAIMEKADEYKDYELFAIVDRAELDTPLKDIWNALYATLTEASEYGNRVVNMGTVLEHFLAPPYGINPALMELLVAALFHKFTREVDIFKNFKKVQNTGDQSLLTRIKVDYEGVRMTVRDPGDVIVQFSEYPSEEKLFVNKIIEIFARRKPEVSDTPLWEEGRIAMLEWYLSLPELTRNNPNFKRKEIYDFMEMLDKKIATLKGRDFFIKLLPETLGFDTTGFSYKTSALKMLKIIKTIFVNLSKYQKVKEAALWKAINSIFAGKGKTFEDNFAAWIESIPRDLLTERLSPDAMILYLKTDPHTDLKNLFLSTIPDELGIGKFEGWKSDRTLEYLARLTRAKLELEVSYLQTTFMMPVHKEPREEIMRSIFSDIFTRFNISSEEKEFYVVDLMEKCVWEG